MESVKKFFQENDQLAKHLGIELLEVGKGTAKAKMEIKDFHLNGVKTVHGGTIFSLADFVFAVASNSHGNIAMAINVSISFLKAVTKGILYAEAKELSLNPKIGTYTINITNDENDLIAVFNGMVYRKKETLSF